MKNKIIICLGAGIIALLVLVLCYLHLDHKSFIRKVNERESIIMLEPRFKQFPFLDKVLGADIIHLQIPYAPRELIVEAAQYKTIKTLNISNTAIGDLSFLVNLSELEQLILVGAEFSNLTSLKDLPSIKTIDLLRTDAQEADVETLRRALPNCEIRTKHANYEPRKSSKESTKSMFQQTVEQNK